MKVRIQGATQTQDIIVDYGLAPTSATLVTPRCPSPSPCSR
ncbi:hypothetical protein ACN28S_61640 [Cystobacter fuscus]